MRYIVTFKDDHVAYFKKHDNPNQPNLVACTPDWKPTHISGWTEQVLTQSKTVKHLRKVSNDEVQP
ncbi:hypothetical protein Presley_7 [Acinetobacter phage Presley]|uniref:Uncharacterized protein n=1 Tax=Acinetobacter phage Presley TaxID=1406780 RepID=U5PVZ0_9CAUD|nr:hypothetical protein Presley_7 [Acinetobacter phage Presley]AGY48074.1 hypothetical protein Presley_7 [Acinetobacter phage Presley]